ncbi:Glycosyltransferase involved in cell wall bisynthesis [Kytococcus aerolatus]|uniref:Glycosyltransferase involved in cell wall bisynthesis n=1 Tax=Kytococcus aerolatus TaxID=592308 RepID=A0A212T6P6_9MICO|nr:glycosyltransferase [Kytococcus aerolatus]SNC61733.1 Glycosyltransferase involved in cell wall bisynthesis [Kytococcus aerolatus]
MKRFEFVSDGAWSGGGGAYFNNVAHAAARHSILAGGPGAIPVFPRNVPHGRNLPETYLLAPQNAWPWAIRGAAKSELRRVLLLRAASEWHMRRASAIHRISGAIPTLGDPAKYSPVMHNPLDTGFEEALAASEDESVPVARGRFVAIGSLNSYRNVSTLFEGYRRYREGGGTHGLYVAGPPKAPEVLRCLQAQAQGIPDLEFHPGALSRPVALAALREAHAVVIPSRVEASPFSVLEAVSLQPRVIPSAALGVREILLRLKTADDEAFFDPDSPAALARALWTPPDVSADWHRALRTHAQREQERLVWGDELARWLESLEIPIPRP